MMRVSLLLLTGPALLTAGMAQADRIAVDLVTPQATKVGVLDIRGNELGGELRAAVDIDFARGSQALLPSLEPLGGSIEPTAVESEVGPSDVLADGFVPGITRDVLAPAAWYRDVVSRPRGRPDDLRGGKGSRAVRAHLRRAPPNAEPGLILRPPRHRYAAVPGRPSRAPDPLRGELRRPRRFDASARQRLRSHPLRD
jgi:hypothetical protein